MIVEALASAKVLAAGVCPVAPPGMQNYQDQVVGWIKWGILGLLIAAALASIGSILVGRIFSHPHASRYGAMGLAVVVICAILYVTILGIVAGIVGTGC